MASLETLTIRRTNEDAVIYGSVKDGKNPKILTKAMVEKLAHEIENKYNFDTAFAEEVTDKSTSKVSYTILIAIDPKSEGFKGEPQRFINVFRKYYPEIKGSYIKPFLDDKTQKYYFGIEWQK